MAAGVRIQWLTGRIDIAEGPRWGSPPNACNIYILHYFLDIPSAEQC